MLDSPPSHGVVVSQADGGNTSCEAENFVQGVRRYSNFGTTICSCMEDDRSHPFAPCRVFGLREDSGVVTARRHLAVVIVAILDEPVPDAHCGDSEVDLKPTAVVPDFLAGLAAAAAAVDADAAVAVVDDDAAVSAAPAP